MSTSAAIADPLFRPSSLVSREALDSWSGITSLLARYEIRFTGALFYRGAAATFMEYGLRAVG
jgi:hypothetical protein